MRLAVLPVSSSEGPPVVKVYWGPGGQKGPFGWPFVWEPPADVEWVEDVNVRSNLKRRSEAKRLEAFVISWPPKCGLKQLWFHLFKHSV